MGGNTYTTCPGTGAPVATVTSFVPSPGPGRPGGDGEGVCAVCGRIISQRGGFAKRHADKRETARNDGCVCCPKPSDGQPHSIACTARRRAHLECHFDRLLEVVKFYADPKHWEAVLIREAPAGGPNPGAQEWRSGAAIDGGLRARRALGIDGSQEVPDA